MTEFKDKCPIWGTPAQILRPEGKHGERVVSDRAGGSYFLARTAKPKIEKMNDKEKAKLTTWIIDENECGENLPEIDTNVINKINEQRELYIDDRADKLIRYIIKKENNLGHTFWIENSNKILAITESIDFFEVKYLRDYLHEKGLIKLIGEPHKGGGQQIMLTPAGHAYFGSQNVQSDQAFVAMWFDDGMKEIYEKGIKPGIENAGYKAVRIDDKEHNNKIDDEIIAEIRRSRFLVADFTHGEEGPRGGVYYEAGFALGINIPVIYTCEHDMIDKVHFDTRQFNHITWEKAKDLRKRLANRISATLGDGPHKNRD